MSEITIANSTVTTNLTTILSADDIVPGAEPSYQLCKSIYIFHPLGAKMAESPIKTAQSQSREITIQTGPQEKLKEAFVQQWKDDRNDAHIFATAALARVYGISAIAMLIDGVDSNVDIDYKQLYKQTISYNAFDPLNFAGSAVLNQNPNAMDFQKTTGVTVQGSVYARSRTVVQMNEVPLYISYTPSAFGFSGRSVYQRALFPLKSFIQTMVADDMVARKAAIIVAKVEQPGSIIDNVMNKMTVFKRNILKQAQNTNVISVGTDDGVESIDLTNVNTALMESRKNILENCAVAADMPAKLLNSETFAQGFDDGSEDAKAVAKYIDGIREWLDPLYKWFDEITMYRAWNPDFYKTIQELFPDEYGDVEYNTAFIGWRNNFKAIWPSLLTEPDSEKVKVDDVRLRAVMAMMELIVPMIDPTNKLAVIQWACDNFNELKLLFGSTLELDWEELEGWLEKQAAKQDEMHKNSMQAQKEGGKPALGGSFAKDAQSKPARERPARRQYELSFDSVFGTKKPPTAPIKDIPPKGTA